MFYLLWFLLGFFFGMVAVVYMNTKTDPDKTLERLQLLQEEQDMLRSLEVERARLEGRLQTMVENIIGNKKKV